MRVSTDANVDLERRPRRRSLRLLVVCLPPFVTFVVVANIHLNHFYTDGAAFADSAWFSYLASSSVPPDMANPAPIPGQFFTTHVSPIFWLYTVVSRTLLFPLNEVVRFSLFQAAWAAAMTSGLQLGARRHLPSAAAALAAVVLTFNGVVVAILAFPHIELAIPAALILFLGLRVDPGSSVPPAVAWIVLGLGLTVREDAGLHYFGLLATAAVLYRLVGARERASDLVRPAAVCVGYGVVAVALQKVVTAGDDGPNLLRTLYLGDPPYAHLTIGLLRERLGFLLTEKPFLFVPVLLVSPVVMWLRAWVGLAGLLAALPWSIFMVTALAPHVGAFETYYAFPLAACLVWPLFVQPTRSWLIPVALVGCSLLMTSLTFLPEALDGKPHPLPAADFDYVGHYGETDRAAQQLRDDVDALGDYLADDAVATLLTPVLDGDGWVYYLAADGLTGSPRGATIDTVLYYEGAAQQEQFERLAAENGLGYRYVFPGSRVVLVSRSPRPDLVDRWGIMSA